MRKLLVRYALAGICVGIFSASAQSQDASYSEDIVFEGVEGANLEARFFVPYSTKLHPGAVIYHGFDGSQELLSPLAAKLADAGYVVLTYNHRAHSNSTGDFDWDKLMEDAERAITVLSCRNDVDPERIAVLGHSMGGMIAIMAGAQDSRVSVCVAMAAPKSLESSVLFILKNYFNTLSHNTDVKDFLNAFEMRYEIVPHIRWEINLNYLHTTLRDLLDFYFESYRYEPIEYVSRTNKILFLYGTEDDNVNPQDASSMYELAQYPKDLVWIEQAGHSFPEQKSDKILPYIIWWLGLYI